MLVESGATDRYFDYCLEPIRPRRHWRGGLRAESLLRQSLEVGGARGLAAPIDALQASVGRDLTVWGTKWDGARLFWELYFYDPRRERPSAWLQSLARTMEPFARIVPTPRVPAMMVSFDLDAETLARGSIDEVNLYLTGERAHAGRSYAARGQELELRNTYRFFDAKREIDEIVPLLQASAFIDWSREKTLAEVLLPELFACKKICVAKKRTGDGVYYSGLSVEQLLWFLRRFEWPREHVAFVEAEQERLQHLWFDVGLDYEQAPDGRIRYPKTSYYGTV